MKVHGNQGTQQTINWVKESIDAQVNKAKDLGRKPVDQVAGASEQRLSEDRFARGESSGIGVEALSDLKDKNNDANRPPVRGKLHPGMKHGPAPTQEAADDESTGGQEAATEVGVGPPPVHRAEGDEDGHGIIQTPGVPRRPIGP